MRKSNSSLPVFFSAIAILLAGASVSAQRVPAPAPVEILLFTDFECPFCATLAPVLQSTMAQYGTKTHLTIKHHPLPFHTHALLAAKAAYAAGQQNKFSQMHDLLFRNRERLARADLLGYAARLGLNVPAFARAMDSARAADEVARNSAEALALGAAATPTMFVNGQKLVGARSAEELRAAFDAALGLAPSAPATRPFDIKNLDLSSAVFRGPAVAPVTIVGFTDLQCPFCARSAPVLREIAAMYPQQVRIAVKNFPLEFHANAQLAAEALEAAGAQGKFWEMHDLLFSRQDALRREGLDEAARELGLNLRRFGEDLDSHRFAAKVASDLAEGKSLGVDGTPTFFVNGRRLDGARPAADFAAAVRAELEGLSLPSTAAPAVVPERAGEVSARTEFYRGSADAPNTLVWFSDIQSGLTPEADSLVRQLLANYPGRVRVVLRHLPLPIHKQSEMAHEAILAAGAQGRFWEMHTLLVSDPKPWSETDLIQYAARLGLNQPEFSRALREHTYQPAVEKDLEQARRAEIRGSPVFFLNGNRIDGLQPVKLFGEYLLKDKKPPVGE